MYCPRTDKVALCTLALLVQAPIYCNADLGAGLRRARGTQTLLPMQPVSNPVVIPLRRVQSRVVPQAASGSFDIGSIAVGEPAQALSVMFDTSSGNIIFPHRACSTPACREHKRYSSWESSTAFDINVDGEPVQADHRLAKGNGTRNGVNVEFTQADLGEGKAESVLVRDHVCISSGSDDKSCVDVAILAAVRMDDAPFRAMPSDGVIGLGLESLSASPLSSFLGQFFKASNSLLPQFGISFGAEAGEIHLGGHDNSRFAQPLTWFPVDHPEQGFWQVAIVAVSVGGKKIDACTQGCHGIIDTSASRLGVQNSKLAKLNAALSSSVSTDGRCQGPELTFDLGGFELKLEPEDYTGLECIPQLGPLNLEEPEFVGVYAFGETVLRRYYAAFDWGARRIGFAPTSGHNAQPFEKTVIV